MIENIYDKKISEVDSITDGEIGYGGSENIIVKDREDLRKIVEEPCLPACLYLYDRNIRTVNSSANRRDVGNLAYIGIDYDSLDEKNKGILEKLIEEGLIARKELSDNAEQRGGRDIMVRVPVSENDTVGSVSDKFMRIVSAFQEQDVLYGRHDMDSVSQSILDYYSELLHPNEDGEVDFEEFLETVDSAYGYVYDEELDIFGKIKICVTNIENFKRKINQIHNKIEM